MSELISDLVDALAEAAPAAPVRLRQGVVTAIGSGSVTVTIGGSSKAVFGVKYLESYAPTVGDAVWLATDGRDWMVLGMLATTSLDGLAGALSRTTALETRATVLETADATTNKSGLVPVIPSSVAVNSGTASIGPNGAITYSGVGTLDIIGVFSSSFRNYRIVVQSSTTNAAEWQTIQYRTAAGVDSGAIYESLYVEANVSAGPNTREVQTGSTYAKAWPSGQYFGNASLDVFAPNIVLFTTAIGQTTYQLSGSTTMGTIQHSAQYNIAYTGFRIIGTGMKGVMSIYGYRD